ncbi:MAG TPA: hypothetical protein VNJ28_00470, partial [Candidatus Limnocylindrales bacterium]|nr:hypothetical protein [Candidatus Limnocylindrales bacterium]
PRMSAPSDELVWVVPRAALLEGPGWRGVRTGAIDPLLRAVETAGRFAPRSPVERDPSLKQIIPYLVVRDGRRYFLMRRTRAGVDERLHERFSIGVGGHLNPADAETGEPIVRAGLVREWREELAADFLPEFRLVGLLNDDETDVGRVHLGVVFVAEVAGRPVGVREIDKLTGAFAEPDRCAAVLDRMETWSQLVFEHLERGGVR